MMVGLLLPRDVVLEAFLGGWRDVTTEMRQTVPVSIVRGQTDEQSKPGPSRLSLAMENKSGNWTLDNPLGAYTGLLGRNTPMRLALRTASDNFNRTVSNGWGTASNGGTWTLEDPSTQFAVTGSVATQQVTGTNTWVLASLSTPVQKDAYVRMDYVPGFTDVTGGQIEPTIVLRRIDQFTYYTMRVIVTTAEQYQLTIGRRVGGVDTTIGGPVTVSGLTHTSGQAVSIAAMIEGRTVFGKIWLAGQLEPYDWQLIASDDNDTSARWLDGPGSFGIRSGVGSGNTNTKPITFTYDNFEVRAPRATGEISKISEDWDEAHANMVAQVQADGLLRRLSQGKSPEKSALRRAYETDTTSPPVAYWPCEDGPDSDWMASAYQSHPPITFSSNQAPWSPAFATYTGFDCSAPLPVQRGMDYRGSIPGYDDSTHQVQWRFLMSLPATGLPDAPLNLTTLTTNNRHSFQYQLEYGTGGTLKLKLLDIDGSLTDSSGAIAFGVNGKLLLVSIELAQSGADIAWTMATLEVGAPAAGVFSGTFAGLTLGRATDFTFSTGATTTTTCVFGHITLHNTITTIFDQSQELNAWAGETAGARFKRLCSQNNIPYVYYGDLAKTPAMGSQKYKQLVTLLQECADADQGILYEPRSVLGLALRTRTSIYGNPAVMTLDYSAGQVAPPFKPSADDQGTRNDVTLTRLDGSNVRVTQTTGPLNSADPWTDPQAVGRYDTKTELNVQTDGQLLQAANWALAQGTVPDKRYPQLGVDFGAPDLTVAIVATVLGLNIGDRTVVNNMQNAHQFSPVDQLVLGYTETITTKHDHTITFNESPYSVYRVLKFDSTGEFGRWDSGNSTLSTGVNSIVGSLSVSTNGGALWITTANQPTMFPFNILVDGELMTVTAITGAASPQTFTVTRSVNGVVMIHNTGAKIHISTPARIGR